MQSSCMGCLMELAEQDPNILYLTADSGEGGLDLMFRTVPLSSGSRRKIW